MNQYDITLVFFNARLHNTFLSIIGHLGKKYKICVWVAPYFKAERTKETNELFLNYCNELGASVIERSEITTKLLIITHITALTTEYLEKEILNYIRCERKLSMQAFGIAGHKSHRALLDAGFKKHIVFDKALYESLLKEEDRYLLDTIQIFEMGNIIASYPVFDNFNCDYMIAIPTGLSFETKKSVYLFLKHLLDLVHTIDSPESIVIKLHTAMDHEPPFRAGGLFKIFSRKNIASKAAGNILLFFNFLAGQSLIKNSYIMSAVSGALYGKLLKKCTPLSHLTKYWNFGAELFMPGIKKGLITGRSTVVWFALAQRIPVFNCDSECTYTKARYLNIHFGKYGVPFSGSNLHFDNSHWDKVPGPDVNFDFIRFIQTEVNA